jgi:superfamily II DNA/RNA helicase
MEADNTKITKKYYDNISVANRTKQTAYFVQQHDKNKIFTKILKSLSNKQLLVLVKSKKTADVLMDFLNKKELHSLAIHGNHRASQIQEAEIKFNSKEIKILITTDRILEKLTLEDIQALVNYDLPLEASEYFKRLILVDEIGESISFIDPEDEAVLTKIEFMMKTEMSEVEIENFQHTQSPSKIKKDKTKKPRHKKVEQRAKKKAEMKSKWLASE